MPELELPRQQKCRMPLLKIEELRLPKCDKNFPPFISNLLRFQFLVLNNFTCTSDKSIPDRFMRPTPSICMSEGYTFYFQTVGYRIGAISKC
jgi:hypothetical protein